MLWYNSFNIYERNTVLKSKRSVKRRRNKRVRRIITLTLIIVLIAIAVNKISIFKEPRLSENDTSVTQTTEKREDLILWNLTLVNSKNPVPKDWAIEFTYLRNDHKVDSRIYPELQMMFDDCRAAGLLPRINESYRTDEDQQRIFEEKVSAYESGGYSYETAYDKASEYAALPGYSEHQLGLAVDIISEDAKTKTNEAVWNWMAEHCAEYGFILRYPYGKEEITGILYEPWHYRYVGKEAAKAITESGLCLEEYIEQLKKDAAD